MKVIDGAEINTTKKGGVLFVGEAYGEEEDYAGRPFVGSAGQTLDEVAAYGGFRRQDMNITNVVNERPPGDENDFARFSDYQIKEGQAKLDKLVARLRPMLVITMGNIPACHFIPTWATHGRGVVKSVGIEQKRGYFWPGKHGGWVLTILHPATAGYKAVPNYELLCRDMRRAKRWLQGKLPRQTFPEVKPLTHESQIRRLLKGNALAFDIETRWEQIVTCGFCGDDLQPYAARYGRGLELMAELLQGRKGLEGVAHNGPFDVDLLDREDYPTALYTDDSQTGWWALDPELASQDDDEGGRMTKKSLAFLGSLDENGNWPWWKDDDCENELGGIAGYPKEGDDDRLALLKLYNMGGRDSFITRLSWSWIRERLGRENVLTQYRDAFNANLGCISMTRRGWRIDEPLRRERVEVLTERRDTAKAKARDAALAYIEANEIEDFLQSKQCTCCGGGDIAKDQCWRCEGFERKPTKAMLIAKFSNGDLSILKKAEVEAFVLKPCKACQGKGRTYWYDFQPTRHQLKKLLYDCVGAPKWVFRGKVKLDEMARLNLMLWAEGKK